MNRMDVFAVVLVEKPCEILVIGFAMFKFLAQEDVFAFEGVGLVGGL